MYYFNQSTYIFTICTPTYNCGHLIHRVYNSLIKQTFSNFEWIIIDDGSTDDTWKVVNNWLNQKIIELRYIYKLNGGKHTAINMGIKQSRGDLFIIADADDEFVPDALRLFYKYWIDIDERERHKYSGVVSLCMNESGKIIGDEYPRDVFDSNLLDCEFRYKIKGEKWGFTRTEILRENLFPEYKGILYFPEGIVWRKIGKKYKQRYLNIPLRIYYQDNINSISKKSNSFNHNHNFIQYHYYNDTVANYYKYIAHSPLFFLKASAQICRYGLKCNYNLFNIIINLRKILPKLLFFIMLPSGLLLFFKKK